MVKNTMQCNNNTHTSGS